MLQIDNVTKQYGKFTALSEIDLSLENGVYGLLAPNGAGKTTLLKMLATLLFPTSGQIRLDGEDIFQMESRYREKIGYLPQEFGYYKNNTPRQFLRYIAALKGIPARQARPRIEELLETVSMTEHGDKKMKKFSGGMIQRIGIAQAMLNDPEILILDEPTAGLDPKERARFRNLLHGLAENRIVLLSTHIVSDVETIAHQVILLRGHRLHACQPPAEICQTLSGRVFELPLGEALPEGAVFLSERQTGADAMQRVACETAPEGGVPVPAGLEDVFLYLYREEGV